MALGHARRGKRPREARALLEIDRHHVLALREGHDDQNAHQSPAAGTTAGPARRSAAARSTKRSTIVSTIWPNTGPITASSARLENA